MKRKSMFDKEENRAMETFFAEYMRKNSRAYISVLALILLFECVMIVRALILFDFSQHRFQLYFISYVFLFVITAVGLYVTLRNRAGRISPNSVTISLHLYCTAIIVWSLLVTYLDLSRGSSPIVFLTVIMAVGGLSVVHPMYYLVHLLISFAVLLSFRHFGEIRFFQTSSGGVYFNLLIFVVASLLLDIHHYQISRRELELSRDLENLSYRDQLTGIANRRMYDKTCAKLETAEEDVTVGMLDLDGFKGINDTYGHSVGDDCLIRVASLLREAFGERTFRFGGDEFAVLSPLTDENAIREKLRRINETLGTDFPGKNISISGGFILRPSGSTMSLDAAEQAADKALYVAKGNGKHQSCFAETAR